MLVVAPTDIFKPQNSLVISAPGPAVRSVARLSEQQEEKGAMITDLKSHFLGHEDLDTIGVGCFDHGSKALGEAPILLARGEQQIPLCPCYLRDVL